MDQGWCQERQLCPTSSYPQAHVERTIRLFGSNTCSFHAWLSALHYSYCTSIRLYVNIARVLAPWKERPFLFTFVSPHSTWNNAVPTEAGKTFAYLTNARLTVNLLFFLEYISCVDIKVYKNLPSGNLHSERKRQTEGEMGEGEEEGERGNYVGFSFLFFSSLSLSLLRVSYDTCYKH